MWSQPRPSTNNYLRELSWAQTASNISLTDDGGAASPYKSLELPPLAPPSLEAFIADSTFPRGVLAECGTGVAGGGVIGITLVGYRRESSGPIESVPPHPYALLLRHTPTALFKVVPKSLTSLTGTPLRVNQASSP